jgi:hypothetical protein
MSQFQSWTTLTTNFETLGAVTTKTFTVPANTRWLVFGGKAERDVNATLDIAIYDGSDNVISAFPQVVAGTTTIYWGFLATASTHALYNAVPLDAGWYIKYTWGAQQTTPEVSCLVAQNPI